MLCRHLLVKTETHDSSSHQSTCLRTKLLARRLGITEANTCTVLEVLGMFSQQILEELLPPPPLLFPSSPLSAPEEVNSLRAEDFLLELLLLLMMAEVADPDAPLLPEGVEVWEESWELFFRSWELFLLLFARGEFKRYELLLTPGKFGNTACGEKHSKTVVY